MKVTAKTQAEKAKEYQAVDPSARAQLRPTTTRDLFDQFSMLLDKIADQLAEGPQSEKAAPAAQPKLETAQEKAGSGLKDKAACSDGCWAAKKSEKPEQPEVTDEESDEEQVAQSDAEQVAQTETQQAQAAADGEATEETDDAAVLDAKEGSEDEIELEEQTESEVEEFVGEEAQEQTEQVLVDDAQIEEESVEQSAEGDVAEEAVEELPEVEASEVDSVASSKAASQVKEGEPEAAGQETPLESVEPDSKKPEVKVSVKADLQDHPQHEKPEVEVPHTPQHVELPEQVVQKLEEMLSNPKAASSSPSLLEKPGLAEEFEKALRLLSGELQATEQAGKDSVQDSTGQEVVIHPVFLKIAMDSFGGKGAEAGQGLPSQFQSQVVEAAASKETNFEKATTSESTRTKQLPKSLQNRAMEKIEQVLKEISKSQDGKSLSVRLDPPSLGSVKIDVTLRDGMLHARMVAESPAVNQMLRDKMHEVQSMLRKLGLDVDTVSVSVGSDQQARAEGQAHSGGNNTQGRGQGHSGAGNEIQDEVQIVTPQTVTADDHWVA